MREPVRADQRSHPRDPTTAARPRPVPAPTNRSDFSTTGWTVTDDGGVWTMQEPYGAYTWYAVNDQPSDKALYSFTISAPSPWVGVANGELRVARRGGRRHRHHVGARRAGVVLPRHDRDRRLHDDRGRVVVAGSRSPTGPHRDQPGLLERLRAAPAALDWLEDRLGPVPLRLPRLPRRRLQERHGDPDDDHARRRPQYATSPEVLLHEAAHQWYGDQVTPTDWRDVWMNEGMAIYLQGVWTAEAQGQPLDVGDGLLGELRAAAARARRARPPTTTRPSSAPATSTTARR